MKFAIITHVSHIKEQNSFYAYAPYVKEMNVWLNYVDEVIIVAPLIEEVKTEIDSAYTSNAITFKTVPQFNLLTAKATIRTLLSIPKIVITIYQAMKAADHIHLRCPGNMGLLGCLVQLLFPIKPKTAKYAGNWDPKAKQPWSYKVQKWILSNTLLTRNIKVLVYGEWENSTANIKPFFTASYFKNQITDTKPRSLNGTLSFLFVGTLSNGKQPEYAVKLIEALNQKGYEVQLTLYGEGVERTYLEEYVKDHKLEHIVFFMGNQNQEVVKQAYLANHFVILPSLSEGWPKVIAEGMFWGCLPMASKVSCVPNMIDHGNRGLLLEMKLEKDVKQIMDLVNDEKQYDLKVEKAMSWSRNYTLDDFDAEIKKLVHP
jgi:glycosyltransferase involved in cell wall biosynthesis